MRDNEKERDERKGKVIKEWKVKDKDKKIRKRDG